MDECRVSNPAKRFYLPEHGGGGDGRVPMSGIGEEVESVSPVTTAAVFMGDGAFDDWEWIHAFIELGAVVDGHALSDLIDICVEGTLAGDAGALGDAVVIAKKVNDAWGVVLEAGPINGHPPG